MRKISLGTVSLTTDSFDSVDEMDDNPSPPKSTRPRLRLKHLRLLLLSACAVAATACASLRAADHSDPALAAAQAEAEQAMAQAKESMAAAEAAAAAQAAAEAAAAAAMKEAEMARAEAEGAMMDAEMARSEAEGAMKDAEMARSEADAASDKLMMAMAPHPAEVMVSADQFDPDLLDISGARASLAGPDSIYLSSIMYAGQPYSALLEYSGGTTATVAAIFGASGKMIPDSVDLSRTRLVFRGPDKLVVADVAVGSAGYSGELTYVGGNKLQVTGLRSVVLPPTADEQIAALRAELAAAEALVLQADVAAGDARAEAEAAMADAEAARAERDAAEAERNAAQLARSEAQIMAEDAGVAQWVAETDAAAARAELDSVLAGMFQPSAVMVADDMLDPSLGSLADARVAVAGPDSVYISSIRYGGQSYSALLKYTGGTSAEVSQVYGSAGKLIPDSVDLSQTELTFVAPASLQVSNVSVGGVGYSGTLTYAGDGKLQVTGIRQVELPADALDEAQAALARVEAALAASQADNAAMSDQVASLQGDVASLEGDVASLEADLQAAQFSADEGHAMAAEAKATIDAMMADAYQPSAIMISDGQIDPSKASFADARVAVAGPDSVYVSSILYDGQRYSALLKYTGGTTAEVQQIYGAAGKLIPDSVDLSQTELVFVSPNAWEVSNVSVGGSGYSGTLAYTGDGTLQVTGIRMVELPPTALEEAQAALAEVEAALAAAQAANDALEADSAAQGEMIASLEADLADANAMADDAQASADMAMADLDAMMADAYQPSAVMISDGQIDPSKASFADARVAVAGPDSVYVSSILYDGQRYSALLKYTGGTTAEVQQIYGAAGKLIPDSVDLSQTELVFVSPNAWEVSNVSVSGSGYSGTLAYTGDGTLQVTGIRMVELPPTALEEAQAALAEVEAALAAAQAANDALEADSAAQGEMIASLEADLADANAMADDAQASAAMSMADADMAKAALEAMMADAFQPSAVMISDGQIDPSKASFADARVAVAGPDSVYVSSILYDGQRYSALLRYTGGTTAQVRQVFGSSGKLIPDSVDLSQTELVFMAPNAWEVSNVSVGGVGYSGTLEYAGDGTLQVTGIRMVELPPTAREEAQAALAEVQAALAAAQSENSAQSEEIASLAADLEAANNMASAAQAAADEAQAEADMAGDELAAMIAAAFQPSAIMISDSQIDPSRASFASARISLAGPDSVYVSSIMYDGQHYSALLRYTGGTTAEVSHVFGSSGKLIPDSVDLSQTELVFVAPNAWEVSNVSVGGAGYSGTLEYAGDGKLQVTGIRQVQLPPTTMDMLADAKAELEAALADASAKGEQIAALESELQTAQAALEAAQADAEAAQAAADAARDAAHMANAELDAMKMGMHQPSEVMVSFADLDASLVDFGNAVASLAGPDAVYVSNIMYAGRPYSALLAYAGGTTAVVEQVFGPDGKLIPDSVSLSQTEIAFRSPDTFAVSNVSVGGNGYSGTLRYTGNGQLQVTGIRRVTLPPTEAEMAAAAIEAAKADAAQMVSDAKAEAEEMVSAAMADAAQMVSDAEAAADAAVSAARAEADAARAELEAMKMAMRQASEVMISFGSLDAALANFDNAQASLAGPDMIYISSIMYDGQPYSALVKYGGGTTATVLGVYGAAGKLIPDAVGLSQTTVAFVLPDSFAVSNVNVGGVGYSGTLQYTGNGQLQVTGIRRVTLPPTEAEKAAAAIDAAMADADRMVSAAMADADAALSAAMAEADQMVNDAKAAADEMVSAAMADADTRVDAAMARAAAAEAELDAMKMAMHQPSAVQVAFSQLDAGLADFGSAQVSLAGPDAIYVSNIMYGGEPYSALLKYAGGTSATVQYVFGPVGKLIPDSVDLSQTTVAFESPDSFRVSNVGVGGAGYSGTLQYTGDGQLQVSGLSRVNLPTKPEALLADARADLADARAELSAALTELAAQKQELDAANADAEAARLALAAANNALAAANSELDAANDALDMAESRAMALETEIAALMEGSSLPGLNVGLLDLEAASLSAAGPNEVYISGIQYAGAPVSARIRYDAGTATATALFEGANLVADSLQLDAAQPSLEDDMLVISNVGIEGRAHTLTLTRGADGQVMVTASDDGWDVRTRGELARDNLIRTGNFVVNGFAGGEALPGEGTWDSQGGSIVQSDADSTHAKFSIPADQSADTLLFGFSANADGGSKVGFGLHILASATPDSGNTWNYGNSYLLWVTQDPFYDSEDLHLQFYESADDNTLMWLASSRIPHGLSSMINVEALYRDTGMTTLLVNGEEHLTVNVGTGVRGGDTIALRTLHGPVEFTQVYVAAP